MLAKMIDKIVSLKETKTFEIGGQTYCGLRGAAGVGLVDTSSKKEEKDHE